METKLTIFTPTYNRAYILPKLYNSLMNQSNKEFIWLVVDDGSTDETEMLVKKWIDESNICIQYIKQENQGKHIAHNTGVENCQTELFFCVDSDDYLLNNAVDDILSEYPNIRENSISGIVSLKLKPDYTPVGTKIPKNVPYSSLSDLYEKYNFKGDTALIFKTSILKRYKFPKIRGEKFVGEEYIYCQIDEKYNLYISSKSYYVCDYLCDGYTSNMFNLIAKNPKGYMKLKQMKLKTSKRFFPSYKAASLYIVGGWLAGESKILKTSTKKTYVILAYPLALIVYIVRFYKISRSKLL